MVIRLAFIQGQKSIYLFIFLSINVVLDSTVTPRIILQGPGYKKSDNSAVWSCFILIPFIPLVYYI